MGEKDLNTRKKEGRKRSQKWVGWTVKREERWWHWFHVRAKYEKVEPWNLQDNVFWSKVWRIFKALYTSMLESVRSGQERRMIFFFFNFIYLFLFLAALGLRCCVRAFSSCGERGLLFVAVGAHCGGFSYCGAKDLGAQASVVAARGLSSCGSRA